MTTQLLIYEQAVPVSVERHGDLSVKAGGDFSFARHVNSVPLTIRKRDRVTTETGFACDGERSSGVQSSGKQYECICHLPG